MNKTNLKDKSLTHINWIRALDNKFSAQKAQKDYYKARILEENSKKHRKSLEKHTKSIEKMRQNG